MEDSLQHDQTARIEILKFDGRNKASNAMDWVCVEEPLEIRVRGRSVAVTMRTPGHDAELAAGFLVTEGIIKKRADVVEIAHCTTGEGSHHGNIVNVFLAPGVELDLERLTRHVFASSSCGLCGKASIDSVQQNFPKVNRTFQIQPELLARLPEKLAEAQQTFSKTGGLHAAAIFKKEGELGIAREDVGRHNAVDKVIGWSFLNSSFHAKGRILMISGRASFEIMQKALAAGIEIVAAVSAPSSLAVEFAKESGQTLVGFLRGRSFNVYSHPERIL